MLEGDAQAMVIGSDEEMSMSTKGGSGGRAVTLATQMKRAKFSALLKVEKPQDL